MKIIALLFCICLTISLTAQNYDFGKVSKEELVEKFYPLDSTASAAYLYKYRKSYFNYVQDYVQGDGFELITEVQERVKIYSQEGFDKATKEILLYHSGQGREKVSSIKGYTYNLVNGKVEESKLGKDGIYDSDYNKYWDQIKFTMPNIKQGSVIEFKYTISSPFVSKIDEFELQDDIPIKKIEAIFEAPEYFKFKVNTKGYLMAVAKRETKSDKITFNNKTRIVGATQTTSYRSSDLSFLKNVDRYDLSNVPALKEEPYVDNIDNYRSAAGYELSYTDFPQAPIKYYSTTWEDVVKTIYDNQSFGDELDKTGYYDEDVNALIGSISDPLARIAIIYDFVRSKVRWNGYYGKFCDDGVKSAYKGQSGNVAEINLMLTSMLRFAGLNSNPVLVSTRENGIPLFPTIDGYNYVISCVELPQGTILLDATNKYGGPNILPVRTLNWEGRIIRKDKSSSTISLYPNDKSENKITMLTKLSEDGNLQGGIRFFKTNHNAMIFREDYMPSDKDKFIENLENSYNSMEISDFNVKNDLDLSKPILESLKFSLENQADIINDKIYFSPLFFLKSKENPLKLEKREFPVDFGFPSLTSYTITINLPEGYKVESIPEPSGILLPDNLGSYKYNISSRVNAVQVSIETEINESRISPIYYEILKTYFSKILEKESEQIVLTKI